MRTIEQRSVIIGNESLARAVHKVIKTFLPTSEYFSATLVDDLRDGNEPWSWPKPAIDYKRLLNRCSTVIAVGVGADRVRWLISLVQLLRNRWLEDARLIGVLGSTEEKEQLLSADVLGDGHHSLATIPGHAALCLPLSLNTLLAELERAVSEDERLTARQWKLQFVKESAVWQLMREHSSVQEEWENTSSDIRSLRVRELVLQFRRINWNQSLLPTHEDERKALELKNIIERGELESLGGDTALLHGITCVLRRCYLWPK
jgi:hypothetical protein